jgi:hypothetical protein
MALSMLFSDVPYDSARDSDLWTLTRCRGADNLALLPGMPFWTGVTNGARID